MYKYIFGENMKEYKNLESIINEFLKKEKITEESKIIAIKKEFAKKIINSIECE